MDYKCKLPVAIMMSTLLAGCNTNPAILDGALNGALSQVAKSVGISSNTSNSDDFLSPGDVRKQCRYHKSDKCGADFGTLSVTTQINRNNTTLVRYGNLIEAASGGRLKESKVSEQMFPYIDRGFIEFETNIYVSSTEKPIRPGTYYFKGSYGQQNPSLAVGDIEIKPGVTNIINVKYN